MLSRSVSRNCWLPAIWLCLASGALAGEPEWVEVQSPHFSVVTDAGEKRGREVALRFEQMRAVFGTLMAKAKVSIPVPLQIVAFRNTKEMRQFAPLWHGKPTQVAGVFQGGSDRCFILLDMSAEEPWQVVFHEYGHQLLNGNISSPLQPWFEEGFAEYFSTVKIDGKKADVGAVSVTDWQILRDSGLAKVTDIFRVEHNSAAYNESGDRRSIFYAESWLLVHYIFDKQLMPQVNIYFDHVMNRSTPLEQAIQQAFGMSANDFDKAIRRYWQDGRYGFYSVPTPAGITTAGFTAKPMTLTDAKAVLADMHLHSSDYQDKAIAEFEELLKLQPDNVAALRGLGYAYLRKRDFERASQYFKQAVEHDSNDPRVLYYSAALAQKEQGDSLSRDPERISAMQKQLEKSIALDPEFADAYSVLAFTYMSQGEDDQARTTMMKAISLNPRNEAYQLNLAQLDLVSEEYDEAIALSQQLVKSADPEIAARAAQTISMAESRKEISASRQTPPDIKTPPTPVQHPDAGKMPDSPETEASNPATSASIRFLKGRLVAVDCSKTPVAVLTVKSGSQTWKLSVRDNAHVVLIGADNFSCTWTNQNIAVNYRETGSATGDVISLEVQ